MHYLKDGRLHGRQIASFDPYEYVAANRDLISWLHGGGKIDAASVAQFGSHHYITHGLNEGRQTGFDAWSYLASNPDLIVGLNNGAWGLGEEDAAAYHYVVHGVKEGRATDSFDGTGYAATYADVSAAARAGNLTSVQAIERWATWHYVEYGFWEGRTSGAFDATQYLSNYADLRNAFGGDKQAAAAHYVIYGSVEGRTSLPLSQSADVVTLRLSADSWQGDPLVHVAIDGRSMGNAMLVTAQRGAGNTHELGFVVARGSGPHQVSLQFLNDASVGPGQDRNAYLDGVAVNGVVAPVGGVRIGGGTTAHFAASGTPAGSDRLVIRASQDAYGEWDAAFRVKVDGVDVGGLQAVSARRSLGQVQEFVFGGTFGAGQHRVEVTFTNDAHGTVGQDRNLHIHGIELTGRGYAGPAETIWTTGTRAFTV